MGLFFEPAANIDRTDVRGAIKEALQKDPATVADADAESEKKTNEIAPLGYAKFNAGRFIGAILIFAAIVGCAIGTDAAGLSDSEKALWGLAGTIFGVVVGFLGGEKVGA
jgi:hypothetical protein